MFVFFLKRFCPISRIKRSGDTEVDPVVVDSGIDYRIGLVGGCVCGFSNGIAWEIKLLMFCVVVGDGCKIEFCDRNFSFFLCDATFRFYNFFVRKTIDETIILLICLFYYYPAQISICSVS